MFILSVDSAARMIEHVSIRPPRRVSRPQVGREIFKIPLLVWLQQLLAGLLQLAFLLPVEQGLTAAQIGGAAMLLDKIHGRRAAGQTGNQQHHLLTIAKTVGNPLEGPVQLCLQPGDQRRPPLDVLLKRAAEELVFGSVTTGASNDIEQATKLARAMITRYGMSDEFGMVALETVTNQYLGGDASLACSAETQTQIDQQVVSLVGRQHDKALQILRDNREKLDQLAAYLYENETITGEEFMKILND